MEEIRNLKRIKTRKTSIEFTIALKGILIGLVICLVLSGVTYKNIYEHLKTQAKEHVLALAKIAAEETDGDAFQTLKKGDEDTEIYQKMQKEMFKYFHSEEVNYVYSLDILDEERVQFIVAADPAGEPYPIGEPYIIEDEMLEAFKGKPAVTANPTYDEWGVVYTGYAPIYNSQNQVVGIIGVDSEISKIQKKVNALMIKLISVGILCLGFIIIVNIMLARRVGYSMFMVNQKLIDVIDNDGDLTRKIEVDSGDELEVIAGNVNELLNSIHQNMLEIRKSSNDIKKSFQVFTEDMEQSAEQIIETSKTMQEVNEPNKLD